MLTTLLQVRQDIIATDENAAASCITTAVAALMWLAFACFIGFAIIFYLMGDVFPRKYRTLHYLLVFVTSFSGLMYLTMVNRVGIALLEAGSNHERCYFYLNVLDNAITIPVIVVVLGMMVNARSAELFFYAALSSIFYLSQLIGGFVLSNNRWIFLIYQLLLLGPIVRCLLVLFYQSASKVNNPLIESRYWALAWLITFYYGFSAIMWMINQGSRTMYSEMQIITCTCVDLLIKILFGVILLSQRDLINVVGEMREGKAEFDEDGALTAESRGSSATTGGKSSEERTRVLGTAGARV